MGLGLCWVRRPQQGCLCRKLEDAWSWQTTCLWAFPHRKLRKVAWVQYSELSRSVLSSADGTELLVDGRQRR